MKREIGDLPSGILEFTVAGLLESLNGSLQDTVTGLYLGVAYREGKHRFQPPGGRIWRIAI